MSSASILRLAGSPRAESGRARGRRPRTSQLRRRDLALEPLQRPVPPRSTFVGTPGSGTIDPTDLPCPLNSNDVT